MVPIDENKGEPEDADDDDAFGCFLEADKNDIEKIPLSSTSKPTSSAASPLSCKRRKSRDVVSEQILSYLEKKNKSSTENVMKNNLH